MLYSLICFCFVEKRFEISNLSLEEDINKIMEFNDGGICNPDYGFINYAGRAYKHVSQHLIVRNRNSDMGRLRQPVSSSKPISDMEHVGNICSK